VSCKHLVTDCGLPLCVLAFLREVARLERACRAQRAVAVAPSLGTGNALAHVCSAHGDIRHRKTVCRARDARPGIDPVRRPRIERTRERRAKARTVVASVAQHAAVGVGIFGPARKRAVGEPKPHLAHARGHVEGARYHAARVAGAAFTLLALGVAGAQVLPCVCRAQFAVAACHTGAEGAGSAPDTRVTETGGSGRRVCSRRTFGTGGRVMGWLEAAGPALRTLPRACIICVAAKAGSTDTDHLASGSGAACCRGVRGACKTRLNAVHRKLGIVGIGGAFRAYIWQESVIHKFGHGDAETPIYHSIDLIHKKLVPGKELCNICLCLERACSCAKCTRIHTCSAPAEEHIYSI